MGYRLSISWNINLNRKFKMSICHKNGIFSPASRFTFMGIRIGHGDKNWDNGFQPHTVPGRQNAFEQLTLNSVFDLSHFITGREKHFISLRWQRSQVIHLPAQLTVDGQFNTVNHTVGAKLIYSTYACNIRISLFYLTF